MTTSEKEEVARIFERAADLIDERGWFALDEDGYPLPCSDGGDGNICAALALVDARGGISHRPALRVFAELVAGENYDPSYGDYGYVVEWNDKQTSRKAVTNSLRLAAKELRKES
jgi:hypothetical protein